MDLRVAEEQHGLNAKQLSCIGFLKRGSAPLRVYLLN